MSANVFSMGTDRTGAPHAGRHVRWGLWAFIGKRHDGKVLVRPEGVEPPAYRFEACRSIQLSYGRAQQRTESTMPTRYLLRCRNEPTASASAPVRT